MDYCSAESPIAFYFFMETDLKYVPCEKKNSLPLILLNIQNKESRTIFIKF